MRQKLPTGKDGYIFISYSRFSFLEETFVIEHKNWFIKKKSKYYAIKNNNGKFKSPWAINARIYYKVRRRRLKRKRIRSLTLWSNRY